MAEWKSRGYVPDSDDEGEESQKSDQRSERHSNNQSLADSQDQYGVSPPKTAARQHQTTSIVKIDDFQEQISRRSSPQQSFNDIASSSLSSLSSLGLSEEHSENGHNQADSQRAIREDVTDLEDIDELQRDCVYVQQNRSGSLPRSKVAVVIESVSKRNVAPSLATAQIETDPFNASQVNEAADGEIDTHALSLCEVPSRVPAGYTVGIASKVVNGPTLAGESQNSEADTVRLPPKGADLGAPGGRNLRRRKLAQLHPYTAELEQYRKSLKSRGLQPVHIAEPRFHRQSLSELGTDDREQASSSSSQCSSQQTDLRSPRFKPRRHLPDGLQVFQPPSSDPHPSDSEDELPDLNSLIRQNALSVEFSGAKRRKLIQIPVQRHGRPNLREEDGAFSHDQILRSRTTPDDFDLPISPATTDSLNHNNRCHRSVRPVFKLPHGTKPQFPPTPLPSSELARQTEINEDHNSGKNASEDDSSSTDSDQIPPVVEQNPSELDTAAQDVVVRKHARLIRGVLPASYAKIEIVMQAQHQKANSRDNRCDSPRQSSYRPGVASVRSRPRTKGLSPRSSPVPIVLSDDDDLSSPESPHRGTSFGVPSPQSVDSPMQRLRSSGRNNTIEIPEAGEDNDFDAMLLPSSKRATVRTAGKKPPNKPKTFLPSNRSRTQRDLESGTKTHHQPKITGHIHRKKRKKSPIYRAPRLSVADMNQCLEDFEVVPDFIRVAARTVRARADQGRHSPCRKFLCFPTEEDSQLISKILRDWRRGSIQQPPNNTMVNDTARKPLLECSANGQRFPKYTTKQLSLPQPTSVVHSLERTSRGCTKPAFKLQTSLDHIIDRFAVKVQSPSLIPGGVAMTAPPRAKARLQLRPLLTSDDDTRPAVLESSQLENNKLPSRTAFWRQLNDVNRSKPHHQMADHLMTRFFECGNNTSERPSAQMSTTLEEDVFPKGSATPARPPRPKTFRKRLPKRLEVRSPRVRRASNSMNIAVISDDDTDTHESQGDYSRLFNGLKAYGSQYTITFDVRTLPAGTYFHESTFVGSGAFAESLNIGKVDLDHERRPLVLEHPDDIWRWGAWNDSVSDQLESLCTKISNHTVFPLQETHVYLGQAESSLKKIVTYLSHNLSFADPVDRVSFSRHLVAQLSQVLEGIKGAEGSNLPAFLVDKRINLCNLLSVAAHQIMIIARHDLVPASILDKAVSLLRSCTSETLRFALRRRFNSFRLCIENVKHMQDCVYGIRQDCAAIEALVVVRHLLSDSSHTLNAFWSIVSDSFETTKSQRLTDVSSIELLWERLMLLLPFLDFDARGILKIVQRQQFSQDNWDFIKILLDAAFGAYTAKTPVQPTTLNVYCRALLGRCLHLIKSWSWYHCESLIGLLFDFFAQRGLVPLPHEQGHGSPPYLERLDEALTLDLEPGDQCFHIFLKIIAVGLLRMRQLYQPKKIRDVVWRLMPNHGRTLRKEEDILTTDMAALRNHHDLLCTLYWACPPEARPRLQVIQNLVEIETSHREACHVSIRSWANLLRFQLSTSEPPSCLAPFTEWYTTIYRNSLTQHALARPEAERGVREAFKHNITTVSKDILEATISSNQRQVEAVLLDITTCLKRAIQSTRNLDALQALISGDLTKVFEVGFQPENGGSRGPQLVKVITQVLEIVRICSTKALAIDQSGRSSTKDDSQDYGDWSGIVEDIVGVEAAIPANTLTIFTCFLSDTFQIPLKQLLSNVFGSDEALDSNFLEEAVETWVVMAVVNVKSGLRTWTDYLDPYGRDSWTSLRETEQTKKFAAFYLARLIEEDGNVYGTHRPTILRHYLASLVERESLLKYQHLFTNTLLNVKSPDPLLYNPPFWKNINHDRFEISMTEFSSRRLALISSILSNMRNSVEFPASNAQRGFHDLKNDYKDLLKHMMTSVKHNYQELGQGSNVRGAYVGFAHSVVELLQQHTMFICPVDRFFTDSNAFPLPDADPNYVVGQLKNYALRLHDPKTPKQLGVFVQSVTERAVTDRQEEYLVGHLLTATSDAFESGLPGQQTLRSFLINSVAPPYIEAAIASPCGAILATPLLHSLQPIIQELIRDFDGTTSHSVDAAETILLSLFASVENALRASTLPVLDIPRIRLLTLCFSIIAKALPLHDYIVRLKNPLRPYDDSLDRIVTAASGLLSILLEGAEDESFNGQAYSLQSNAPSTAIQLFIAAELKAALNRNWSHHDGRYYVTRGNQRREVSTDFGTVEEEKWGLVVALDTFLSVHQGIWA